MQELYEQVSNAFKRTECNITKDFMNNLAKNLKENGDKTKDFKNPRLILKDRNINI